MAIKIVQQIQPNLFDSTKYSMEKHNITITFPCINQYHLVHEHKTIPAEPNLNLTIITSQNYID